MFDVREEKRDGRPEEDAGLCGERKALWRDSDTVPEARVQPSLMVKVTTVPLLIAFLMRS